MYELNRVKVVKIGGNVIDNPEALSDFIDKFSRLSGPKILVHGGGKEGMAIICDRNSIGSNICVIKLQVFLVLQANWQHFLYKLLKRQSVMHALHYQF